MRRIARGGRLHVRGLHCHIGTFILDPTAYARSVEKMVKFGYEIQETFGHKMEYIDVGGGFPSRSKLKGMYLSPDVALPFDVDGLAEVGGGTDEVVVEHRGETLLETVFGRQDRHTGQKTSRVNNL